MLLGVFGLGGGVVVLPSEAAVWEQAPPFPDNTQGRLFAVGVNKAGTLYAIGGSPFDASGNAVMHYLPSGATAWSQGASVEGPIVRQGAGIDAFGRIVVFGGRDGVTPGGDLGAVYVYDLVEGQSQGLANRSSLAPVEYFAYATDAQGRVYSIGGGPGATASPVDPNSAHVERYVASTDTWDPVTPMPLAVADAAAVNDGQGHLLVIGGYDEFATTRNATVFQYDVGTDTWSDTAVPAMPVALSGCRAVLGADDRVYVLGGESGPVGGGITEAAVHVLNLNTNTWSVGPTMITPRRNFAAALGDDNSIYAMGGSNDTGGTYLVEKLYTPPCPTITQHPVSINPWIGQTVLLSVTVDGGTPLTYQWKKDGVDLVDGTTPGGSTVSGATTTTVTVSGVTQADTGAYTLVATNPCGSTTSNPAILAVRAPPAIPTTWTVTNLHPAWATSSYAEDVSGDTQGGAASMPVPPYTSLNRPVLWTGSAASAVDLTPSGSVGGAVSAVGAGVQVGWWWWPYQCYVGGKWQTCYQQHAAGWSGTASSHVNLHVSGWEYTSVSGTDGTVHVGSVSRDDAVGNVYTHAVIWNPPNYYGADMHPTGVSKSGAVAVADGHQYGWIHTPFPGPVVHAAMWSGNRSSFVDMHPAGASRSTIYGAGDGQQVGMAEFAGQIHACLWADSPTAVLDLNPPGASSSEAYACQGGLQIGYANIAGTHATIWAGSPENAVDLHGFVPADFASSYAKGMDITPDGTISVVGYGYNATTGRTEALLWQATISGTPADLDGDGDVDSNDFLTFSNCFNGALNPPRPSCANPAADFDGDGDVDPNDFLTFSTCFNGAMNLPGCP